MVRFSFRLSISISFFTFFIFSALAQDAVKFVDKSKKGESELNGLITGDSVKGL